MIKLAVLLLLCFYTFGSLVGDSCITGAKCNDNDYCTGTQDNPDYCEENTCVPGEAVCPFYHKNSVTPNREIITGDLQISNDDSWLYIMWNGQNNFTPSIVSLYVANIPPQTDDFKTYPFQIAEIDDSCTIQIRISLALLGNPSELDPIYISMRLQDAAGSGSWVQGLFTPMHHQYGGSFSYTTVCHCIGYSHVEKLINHDCEIYTFSNYDNEIPEQPIFEDESHAKLLLIPTTILTTMLLFLL